MGRQTGHMWEFVVVLMSPLILLFLGSFVTFFFFWLGVLKLHGVTIQPVLYKSIDSQLVK